ncbi:MAG: hypothetical protein M1609_09485 [Firmicutes bacterium]|nr:hypothetical protein [Bacillota bacterium]
MNNLLHVIPFLVALFEYVAVSSALAFARFAVEVEPQPVSLLGGIINAGGNLPYDAVPNVVVTLHLLALLLSIVYFAYFVFFGPPSEKDCQPVPPQEG